MHHSDRVEKFPSTDLVALQLMLAETGPDDGRAGELLATFLHGRGYGVHPERVHAVLFGMEEGDCEPEQVQEALERVALIM